MDLTRLLCMAGIVLLSLVLPLAATGRPARCAAVAWRGQLLAGFGGLLTACPGLHPVCGLVFVVTAVVFFRRRLHGT